MAETVARYKGFVKIDEDGYIRPDGKEWSKQGFSDPHDIYGYMNAGIYDPAVAAAWKREHIDGQRAARYAQDGITTLERARMRRNAEKFIEIGVSDPVKAARWQERGFDGWEAEPYLRYGIDNPDEAADYETRGGIAAVRAEGRKTLAEQRSELWEKHGFPLAREHTVGHAWVWKSVGVDDPGRAAQWRDSGFTPRQAEQFIAENIEPVVAADWVERGFTISHVKAWWEAGVDDPSEAARIVAAQTASSGRL